MAPLLASFVAGSEGEWRVTSAAAISGPALPEAKALAVREGWHHAEVDGSWVLRGTTSNERYLTAEERDALRAVQEPLGRSTSTAAALIPIRKTEAWWDLAQDERRELFEERSRHVGLGLRYLPSVARRLYHSRDLGEPFDFLTWFEFAPEDEGAFDELVGLLRETDEWWFVEREVDIRLAR